MTHRSLSLLLALLLALPLVWAQEAGEPASAASEEATAESAPLEDSDPEDPEFEDSILEDPDLEDPESEDPAPAASLVDALAADTRFSMLFEALDAAGLLELLEGEGPFTLFAPTDEAFMLLPQEELTALIEDEVALLRLLRYHIAEGLITPESILEIAEAATTEGAAEGATEGAAEIIEVLTLEGELAFITVGSDETEGELFINDAVLLDAGTEVGNGVIYAIGAVLLPPAPNGDEQAGR